MQRLERMETWLGKRTLSAVGIRGHYLDESIITVISFIYEALRTLCDRVATFVRTQWEVCIRISEI